MVRPVEDGRPLYGPEKDVFHDRVRLAREAQMGHRPPPPDDDTTKVREPKWRRARPIDWNGVLRVVVGALIVFGLMGLLLVPHKAGDGVLEPQQMPFIWTLVAGMALGAIRSLAYLAPGARDTVMRLLGFERSVAPDTWDADEEARELRRVHDAYARGDIDDVQLEHSVAHVLAGGTVMQDGTQSNRPRRMPPPRGLGNRTSY